MSEEEVTGKKFDQGKDAWNLLPWEPMIQVVKVLTFGAKKYSARNWQQVKDAKERYGAAAMRHFAAGMLGEKSDPESGLHPFAHVIVCLLFMLWFELKGEK